MHIRCLALCALFAHALTYDLTHIPIYFIELNSTNHSNEIFQAAESEVNFSKDMDGTNMRIGIIKTRWNDKHVDNLVSGIKTALTECKVQEDNIFETSVPGSFELPMAAQFLALSGTVDAIICTGVLIKGDTMHFEYIADAVSKGIMNIGLNTRTPVIFGVLTCLTEEQVIARSTPGDGNHGYDWGKTAVEMALLRAEALGGTTVQAKVLKGMGFAEEKGKKDPKTDKEKIFF
jgi:6,7-dimethyl-8-ribityllumazine synthase